ncbi:hypothetical protein BC940DRAFT_306416 [Gongronella butleri]|nr:hypothetical protein BC940DRAFT_306416 [Gongronella butleri]
MSVENEMARRRAIIIRDLDLPVKEFSPKPVPIVYVVSAKRSQKVFDKLPLYIDTESQMYKKKVSTMKKLTVVVKPSGVMCSVYANNEKYDINVKRAMAETFFASTPDDLIIHKDGNPFNVRAQNLVVVSKKEFASYYLQWLQKMAPGVQHFILEFNTWLLIIDDTGVVYSVHSARALSQQLDAAGYMHVRVNGRSELVHRLVWLAFNQPKTIDPEWEVDHKNNVRHDNRPRNLQLLTANDNRQKPAPPGAPSYARPVPPAPRAPDPLEMLPSSWTTIGRLLQGNHPHHELSICGRVRLVGSTDCLTMQWDQRGEYLCVQIPCSDSGQRVTYRVHQLMAMVYKLPRLDLSAPTVARDSAPSTPSESASSSAATPSAWIEDLRMDSDPPTPTPTPSISSCGQSSSIALADETPTTAEDDPDESALDLYIRMAANGIVIDHASQTDKTDNRLSNLRYVTPRDNATLKSGRIVKIRDLQTGEALVYSSMARANAAIGQRSSKSNDVNHFCRNVTWEGIKRSCVVFQKVDDMEQPLDPTPWQELTPTGSIFMVSDPGSGEEAQKFFSVGEMARVLDMTLGVLQKYIPSEGSSVTIGSKTAPNARAALGFRKLSWNGTRREALTIKCLKKKIAQPTSV